MIGKENFKPWGFLSGRGLNDRETKQFQRSHLLVNYPPDLIVSTLVHKLKSISSHKHLVRVSLVFGVSCGEASLDLIEQYIESQLGIVYLVFRTEVRGYGMALVTYWIIGV